jgi:hypothetical protein
MCDRSMTANPDTPMGWRAEVHAQEASVRGRDGDHFFVQMLCHHDHHGRPPSDDRLTVSPQFDPIAFQHRDQKWLCGLLKFPHPAVVALSADAFDAAAVPLISTSFSIFRSSESCFKVTSFWLTDTINAFRIR